jgi:amino-acid N-acetyltransferase
MHIYPLTQNNFSTAIALLKENNLPVNDITDTVHLFVAYENDEFIGTAGIELLGNMGLLRSVCVAAGKRNSGAGHLLLQHIENYAVNNGIKNLYLLTTTAENYFDKKELKKIDRAAVPDKIKNTTEFSSPCPSEAVVMHKALK